jgi:hypothetical protein
MHYTAIVAYTTTLYNTSEKINKRQKEEENSIDLHLIRCLGVGTLTCVLKPDMSHLYCHIGSSDATHVLKKTGMVSLCRSTSYRCTGCATSHIDY